MGSDRRRREAIELADPTLREDKVDQLSRVVDHLESAGDTLSGSLYTYGGNLFGDGVVSHLQDTRYLLDELLELVDEMLEELK